MAEQNSDRGTLLELTSSIVSAHVGHNAMSAADLPDLLGAVHGKLSELMKGAEPAEELIPAVPIRKSVGKDHVTCLECGAQMKMLKRHLQTAHGMTVEDYRTRWGLPATHAMVAPDYAARRSELARKIGLGKKAPAKKPARRRKSASA